LILELCFSKAIPQMQDTARDALDQLDLSQTKSKLLAIIANTLVIQAASMQQFSILVFLFLFLKNFQMRTTQNHC
jgi:hydroxymethylglutaryl-CoA lyase